jgi:Ca-activated chloride channel family protein
VLASLPRSFLAPGRLWLLLLVVALAVAYVLLQRRRAAYAVRFSSLPLLASVAPRSPGWRRHVPAAVLLLALTAAGTAFARPQADVRVPREQATVVLAVDTSLSMEATDVSPDRITAARGSAADFVEGLPDSFAVGLVSFSGSAAVVVPPTQDHAAVAEAVQALALGPSTAIGEAVFAALDAVAAASGGDGEAPPARIVLLTDGTNTVGRSLDAAAEAAREAGVPVSTISYGTADGVVEVQGQLVPVPVDVAAMEQLARDTGGASFTAESGEELEEVYADIGEQVGTTVEQREVSDVLAGLALLLGLVSAAGSLAWTSRLP